MAYRLDETCTWILLGTDVRIGLPLALSEPEPTQPFGLSLSEPTNRHLPYLLIIQFQTGLDLTGFTGIFFLSR